MPLAFNGSGPVDLGDVLDGQFVKRQGNVLVGDDADFEPSGTVAAHIAAADPHTSYQLESEKGQANGYASLDGLSKIPVAQVPTGSSGSTVCLGNDARLSDARPPLAHTHSLADITNEGALASKNTIATTDIDNDAVTFAKIQNITDARLLGRSAGSAGDAQELTVGSGLSLNAGVLTATGGGGGTEVFALKTSDQTAIGTSLADVTGTGLAVAASKAYAFEFFLIVDADATTTGIDVSCNGPASPASIVYEVSFWTSATARTERCFTAYDGNTASTSSSGTAAKVFRIRGVLRNGANAGTLIARTKREAVGSGPNVRAGSYGRLTPLD